MAEEGSREWVSPHYNTPGYIFVLNRSLSAPIAVTLDFYSEGAGQLLDQLTKIVSIGKSEPFVSHEGAGYNKWVRVTAEGPVYPWGITPVSKLYGDEHHGFVHMSFFRVEGKRRASTGPE